MLLEIGDLGAQYSFLVPPKDFSPLQIIQIEIKKNSFYRTISSLKGKLKLRSYVFCAG